MAITIVLCFPLAQSSVLTSCSMVSPAYSWEGRTYSNDHRWSSVFVCLSLQLKNSTIRLLSSLSPLLPSVMCKVSPIPNKNQLINLNIKNLSLVSGYGNDSLSEIASRVNFIQKQHYIVWKWQPCMIA